MQIAFSATLSHLLPLQLGFDAFSTLAETKFNVIRSKKITEYVDFIEMSLEMCGTS